MRLGPSELAVVLFLAWIVFGKRPTRLAAQVQEALCRFRDELQHSRSPRPDLRGIEWLALAVSVLFLELIWLASRL